MRKMIIAAMVSIVATPAIAQGGIVLGPPQFESYTSRGQCQSALAAERNKQRKDPATRGTGYQDLSGSDFNKASRTTTRCEERHGKFVVVYNQNGF
ncbi:MAG TPA: hypothetical protein VF605_13770 [Allosphingosinicella sp.]